VTANQLSHSSLPLFSRPRLRLPLLFPASGCPSLTVTMTPIVNEGTRMFVWTGAYDHGHVFYRIPGRNKCFVHWYSDGSNFDWGIKVGPTPTPHPTRRLVLDRSHHIARKPCEKQEAGITGK